MGFFSSVSESHISCAVFVGNPLSLITASPVFPPDMNNHTCKWKGRYAEPASQNPVHCCLSYPPVSHCYTRMDGDARSHNFDFPQNWLGSLPGGPQHPLLQLLYHPEYGAPIHAVSSNPCRLLCWDHESSYLQLLSLESWPPSSLVLQVWGQAAHMPPSTVGFPQTASPLNRHPLFPRNQASWSAFTMTVKYFTQHSKEKLKRQWKTMTGTANQSMQSLFSLRTIISSCRPFMLGVYSILHTHN